MNAMTDAERQKVYIRSLLREREGCLRAGKLDRVKAIDEELGEVARDAEPPAKRAQKRPAAPSRRTSR